MIKFEGTIKNVTYYNEENGFAILRLEGVLLAGSDTLFDETEAAITAKGYIPNPVKGETYTLTGRFETHPEYGEQLAVTSHEKHEDFNEAGLIEYLSSDMFTGIGEVSATRIVKTLGKTAIDQIIDDPKVLNKVPKLSKQVKTGLRDQLIENKASQQTLIKLYDFGLSAKLAKRIKDTYQEQALNVIKDNPYKLIEDIDGIGFERADLIAKKLGIKDNDERRIKATIIYFMQHITYQKGHTHIAKEMFVNTLLQALNKDTILTTEADVTKMIKTLKHETILKEEQGALSLHEIAEMESDLAEKLLAHTTSTKAIHHKQLLEAIASFEQTHDFYFDDRQKKAIIHMLKHKLMILTGGPGTGKTTVIKGIIHVFKAIHKVKDDDIKLLAPTGRAAKRMQESTDLEASTIHKFLGYGYDGFFAHDEDHKQAGRLFVIDEASMIDLPLAHHLFSALPDDAHILVVGDDEQLPSVGPGQVLKDMIESNEIKTVTLNTIHRQKNTSTIIHLAASIREGRVPSDLYERYQDRFIITEKAEHFMPRLKRMIDYLINLGYQLHEDIQVLIPMYKGSVGIHAVNAFLQETYNDNKQKSLTYGDATYYINDKVLQLANRAEDGVMNGDQGRITAIDSDDRSLIVAFDGKEVTYQKQDLDQITLAYAMSIHKSQGSEYKAVIMPIFKQYSIMLKKRLLYTGITRAKETLIMAGDIAYISYAVKHIEEGRQTLLKTKLAGTLLNREAQIDSALESFDQTSKTNGHKRISDPAIPFDTLGENLKGLTPYDFMDEQE